MNPDDDIDALIADLLQGRAPDPAQRSPATRRVARLARMLAAVGASEPADDAPAALAGSVLGVYRLQRVIGSGGMGEVWRGERVDDFEQQVAIKLIRPLLDSPHLRERFARERRGIGAGGHRALHAVQGPEQVHRGRPRGAQGRQLGRHARGIRAAGALHREHDPVGRGDADRGRATHHQVADRLRHRDGIAARDPGLLARQAALVEQEQRIAAPLQRANAVVSGQVVHRRRHSSTQAPILRAPQAAPVWTRHSAA